jgi:hypothetical protein
MRASDSLSSLAEDLRALPARERKSILSALSAFERAKVSLLLQQDRHGPAGAQQEEADFRQFSPWLAAYLQDAARGAAAGGEVTAATSHVLAEIAQNRRGQARWLPAAAPIPQRSLVAAIAAWLLPASMLS